MNKQYTREDIINVIDFLIQRPDLMWDAMNNEHTDYDAEAILTIVERETPEAFNPNQLSIL